MDNSEDSMDTRYNWKLVWEWISNTYFGAIGGAITAFIVWLFISFVIFSLDDILLDFFPIEVGFDVVTTNFPRKIISTEAFRVVDPFRPYYMMISLTTIKFIFSYIVAWCQVPVFNQVLGHEDGIDRWASQTAIGATLALWMLSGAGYLTDKSVLPRGIEILVRFFSIMLVAFFQWRILRKYFPAAHRWIWVSVIIFFVTWYLSSLAMHFNDDSQSVPIRIFIALLLLSLPVIFRAITVVWLARDPLPSNIAT